MATYGNPSPIFLKSIGTSNLQSITGPWSGFQNNSIRANMLEIQSVKTKLLWKLFFSLKLSFLGSIMFHELVCKGWMVKWCKTALFWVQIGLFDSRDKSWSFPGPQGFSSAELSWPGISPLELATTLHSDGGQIWGIGQKRVFDAKWSVQFDPNADVGADLDHLKNISLITISKFRLARMKNCIGFCQKFLIVQNVRNVDRPIFFDQWKDAEFVDNFPFQEVGRMVGSPEVFLDPWGDLGKASKSCFSQLLGIDSFEVWF